MPGIRYALYDHLEILWTGRVVGHADGHEPGEAQVPALLLHVPAQRQRIGGLHAVLAGLPAGVHLRRTATRGLLSTGWDC